MKALVTGAHGFIGTHLVLKLQEMGHDVLTFTRHDTDLAEKVLNAEVIFHLAGVNRPQSDDDFETVNVGLTETIISVLTHNQKKVPIVFSSSIQVREDTLYGKSKKKAEEALLTFQEKTNTPVSIFRLPGVFGKWSQPYYNTVVATFIHQVHIGEDLIINDPGKVLQLIYIDDVVNQFIETLKTKDTGIIPLKNTDEIPLASLADVIKDFKKQENAFQVVNQDTRLIKNLYSTYVSFKPLEKLSKPLNIKSDERGSFTEIFKTMTHGQFSVNVAHPHVEKGNHYHHHKHEKFLVISGNAQINLRHKLTGKIQTFDVSEAKFELIDIPPGYVHNIINTGNKDLVTLMWANEIFDSNNPDTYFEKV